jgi:hypothetical protein
MELLNMTLTEQHIENLYAFTRKHFVEYYDLQTELVDHMANDIEAIIEENPHLSFEQARDKAFKKFGVFGFMEVVEERAKVMNKKYMKLLWYYAKDWFRLPQILATLSMFLVFYTIFSFPVSSFIFVGAFLFLCVFLLYKSYKINSKIKQKRKAKEKLWLLEDIIFKNASVGGLFFAPQILHFLYTVDGVSAYKPLICALAFSLIIIYTYISTVVLPNNARTHLKETYPEYSL